MHTNSSGPYSVQAHVRRRAAVVPFAPPRWCQTVPRRRLVGTSVTAELRLVPTCTSLTTTKITLFKPGPGVYLTAVQKSGPNACFVTSVVGDQKQDAK